MRSDPPPLSSGSRGDKWLPRDVAPDAARCASCGALGYNGDRYCACCGEPMIRECRACGAPMMRPLANYCVACGAPLTER